MKEESKDIYVHDLAEIRGANRYKEINKMLNKFEKEVRLVTLKEVYESACNCVTIEGFCGLMERNYKKELKKK